MRKKAPKLEIPVAIGDLAEFDLEDRFSLVYVVGNTFFVLQSQDAQVRCFENVAAHLQPGGRFVLGCFVPDMERLRGGQSVRVMDITPEAVKLVASKIDTVEQTLTFQITETTEKGVRMFPGRHRWCWPSEMDLMARLAGLRPEHRWGGFDRAPFTPASRNHVSVYVKA